jgi:ABC-2 type transport system ATP-binding protein
VTTRSPAHDASAIRAEHLTKTYSGRIEAVAGLDLEVAVAEVFGLLGPNGAGKTTTIGMLTTRVRPTSGWAQVGGSDVRADAVGVKRVIGVVSQTNTLDRALNVRENLIAHGWYFGLDDRDARRAADLLLELFNLVPWATHRVADLSGGTAQRVMLARAVMHRPAVLFLDEPSSGLDPQSRLAIWSQLESLHRDGQTILLTTHDMEEADRLCDRIGIVDHGTVLALGTPDELKRVHGGIAEVRVATVGDPAGLACGLQGRLARVLAQAPDVDYHARTISLAVTCSDGAVREVLRAADEGGVELADVVVDRPTLERVFLNLTGKRLRT